MTTVPLPSDRSRDLYALGRRLDKMQSEIEFLKTQRTAISVAVQADINASNGFGAGVFAEAISRTVDVPRGYFSCYVLLFCSAGQSVVTGSGNVGVWPVVDVTFTGPPISNGTPSPGPVSASTFFAVQRTGLAPGSQIRLAAWVANTGTLSPGSANVHLSASLLFLP